MALSSKASAWRAIALLVLCCAASATARNIPEPATSPIFGAKTHRSLLSVAARRRLLGNGNGAPVGAHFNLNMIAQEAGSCPSLSECEVDGNAVFVPTTGAAQIYLRNSSDGNFTITDCSACDGKNDAKLELPIPDTGAPVSFQIWARRPPGKKQGSIGFSMCAEQVCDYEAVTNTTAESCTGAFEGYTLEELLAAGGSCESCDASFETDESTVEGGCLRKINCIAESWCNVNTFTVDNPAAFSKKKFTDVTSALTDFVVPVFPDCEDNSTWLDPSTGADDASWCTAEGLLDPAANCTDAGAPSLCWAKQRGKWVNQCTCSQEVDCAATFSCQPFWWKSGLSAFDEDVLRLFWDVETNELKPGNNLQLRFYPCHDAPSNGKGVCCPDVPGNWCYQDEIV